MISLSKIPTDRRVQQYTRNPGYWIVAKYGSPRETGKSKQCEFCMYLLDNSLNQSKWSGWSFWSVLLGAEDGQGVQRRVVNKENCGIVGFMGTLMIRHACTLTDRQWKVGPS